jgi:hypothetical protein
LVNIFQSFLEQIKEMQHFHDNFTIMALKKNTPPQVEKPSVPSPDLSLHTKDVQNDSNISFSDNTIENDSSDDQRNESKQHTSIIQELSEKQPDSQNIPDELNNLPNEPDVEG